MAGLVPEVGVGDVARQMIVSWSLTVDRHAAGSAGFIAIVLP